MDLAAPWGDGLAAEFLDVFATVGDVGDSLGTGFAFEAEVPAEIDLVEGVEEGGPIDFTGSDHDLFTPGAGGLGSAGVLQMNLTDPRCQRAEGGDGIALVIEQHVRRVEVDADIAAVEPGEELAEGRGVFLAGFKRDLQAVHGEEVGDASDTFEKLGEGGIGFVVGKESGVQGDEPETEMDGDAGIGLEVLPVLFPGGIGNDAAGDADGIEGGVVFTDGGHHAGHESDALLGAESGGVGPDNGLFAEGIEVELEGADPGAGEAREEFGG